MYMDVQGVIIAGGVKIHEGKNQKEIQTNQKLNQNSVYSPEELSLSDETLQGMNPTRTLRNLKKWFKELWEVSLPNGILRCVTYV